MFVAELPLYLIGHQVRRDGDELHADGLASVGMGTENLLAVFTDEDLAERYLATTKFPDGRVFSIGRKNEFIAVLAIATELGCNYIAFDPSGEVGRDTPTTCSIEHAIDMLRR